MSTNYPSQWTGAKVKRNMFKSKPLPKGGIATVKNLVPTHPWNNSKLSHRHQNPDVKGMPNPIRQHRLSFRNWQTHRTKSDLERGKKQDCRENHGSTRQEGRRQGQVPKRSARTRSGNHCRSSRLELVTINRLSPISPFDFLLF